MSWVSFRSWDYVSSDYRLVKLTIRFLLSSPIINIHPLRSLPMCFLCCLTSRSTRNTNLCVHRAKPPLYDGISPLFLSEDRALSSPIAISFQRESKREIATEQSPKISPCLQRSNVGKKHTRRLLHPQMLSIWLVLSQKPPPIPPPAGAATQPENLVSPLLYQNTNAANPGIFLRLMPTGLAYLREIGMKVVNDEILKINLPTITESVDAGQVSIFNAYVSKYWPPVEYSLDLVAPDTFTWAMSKMHMRASGGFEARLNGALLLPSVPIRGEFEALLGHIGLTISVRMLRSTTGAPQVIGTYCNAQVGYVDLSVRNTGVLTDFFINSFKAFLIAHFKPTVEQRMCQMIENVINRDMNSILATMPLKVRINENNVDIIGQTFGITDYNRPAQYPAYSPPQPAPAHPIHRAHASKTSEKSKLPLPPAKNLTLLNFVNQLRERNLVLDFSLIDEPFVSQGTVLMKSRGEISWAGLGGTPFYPPNVVIPAPHGVHMAEFFGTDYIANSMLYHAFRQQYMDVTVGPESSPQLRDVLQTTCPSGFCIGEFLGALGEQYPDRQIEIHFAAKKAPIMVFVENRARFRLHGRLNMYVRPNPANSTQVKVQLLESSIRDVDQSTFGDLGLFGAEFLEKLLTEILQMGIVMPTMRGVVLRSPKLSIHERYIKVQTYFKLDEQYAEKLIQGAVRQTLVNVG
ncbi:lipopolysaccharide-binding protein [Ditylenchus destructor]|nr:lipopolysaccharide-binding protein [Ditylenchus destructor]